MKKIRNGKANNQTQSKDAAWLDIRRNKATEYMNTRKLIPEEQGLDRIHLSIKHDRQRMNPQLVPIEDCGELVICNWREEEKLHHKYISQEIPCQRWCK